MICSKCGKELDNNALFCPLCGGKAVPAANGEDTSLYQADVKGLLKSGKLVVYRDRTEFELSRVQKMIFSYSSLAAVKKGMDRINFIMDDGRTESCTVNRKNIHEAYFTIEQACRPYLAARRQRLAADGIRYSFPCSRPGLSGILNSGLLNVSDDKCEYITPSGKNETISYQDIKSARSSAVGALELIQYDGTKHAFTADKEIREEVVSFLQTALVPFIEERRERLLSEGIYFSFPGSKGVCNIYEDRIAFLTGAESEDTVSFPDIRDVRMSGSSLEIGLTDGTSKLLPIDKDFQNEVLSFLENAIAPYVEARTKGFDIVFGAEECLEVNEARGVFHIIRQGGKEISAEYGLRDILTAEAVESRSSRDIAGMLRTIKGGDKEDNVTEERITGTGLLLTVQTDGGTEKIPVCLSSFTFGIARTNPEYERCLAEQADFFSYMERNHPDCKRIPLPPTETAKTANSDSADPASAPSVSVNAADPAADDENQERKTILPGGVEKEQFGTLIDGVSDFVEKCATPMTIAIQGDWETGSNGFIRMVYNSLEEKYRENILWLYTWQFSQFDLGEQLPMLLADKLIELLGGSMNEEAKMRAKMLAQGVIGIASGLLSQGGSDGTKLSDAIFKDNLANTLEQKVKLFTDLVKRKIGNEDGKIIIFIDDLNRLAPAKAVELLNAMRYFFDCPGCIFLVAVDRESVIRGLREINGPEYEEEKGNAYFDRLFRTAFHVPKNRFDMQKYIVNNLTRVNIQTDSEEEIRHYAQLASLSVGGNPKALERLFNSYLLLKSLTDEEAFSDWKRRLILFALLCMQSRFPGIYQCLAKKKDLLTPAFLTSLPAGSDLEEEAGLDETEKQEFRKFAAELYNAINTNTADGITEAECGAFARALSLSAITFAR